MNKVPIVKPGDKAIAYLNTYHTNFSRENPLDKSEGDCLWLPENHEYQSGDSSIPLGLMIRSVHEVEHISTALLLEATRGDYEVSDVVIGCDNNSNLEVALNRLDAGEAQMLLTYSSMLPKSIMVNGLPSETFLARARENHWRIGLVFLYAHPMSNLMSWRSTYAHFGKEDAFELVLVNIIDASYEKSLKAFTQTHGEAVPAKSRKGLFRKRI